MIEFFFSGYGKSGKGGINKAHGWTRVSRIGQEKADTEKADQSNRAETAGKGGFNIAHG